VGEMTVEDMTMMLQGALLSMKITIRTECGKYSVEEWKFEDGEIVLYGLEDGK
jgi:hypothetical protein